MTEEYSPDSEYPLSQSGSRGLKLFVGRKVAKTTCCDCNEYKNCLKITDWNDKYLYLCKKCFCDFFDSDDECESEEESE